MLPSGPVLRLPLEILGEISALCVSDPNADVQLLRTLSSICTAWRVATLRTPKAWSSIVFRYPRGGVCPVPRNFLCTFQDVQEWFERSGSCSKDVAIRCFRGMPLTQQTALAELVSAHAPEMRSLSIRFAASDNDEALLLRRSFRTPMLSLQVLDITGFLRMPPASSFIRQGTPLLAVEEIASIIDGLPRLHAIISHDLPFQLPDSLRPRLTTLFMKLPDMQTLILRLQMAGGFNPTMRSLCLYSPTCRMVWRPPDNPQFECNVEVFQLHTAAYRTGFLFQMIRFPRLRKLSLRSSSFVRVHQKDAFEAFKLLLDTSNPTLRELYLEGVLI